MHESTWVYLLVGLTLVVVGSVGGLAVVAFLLVKLPPDYFSNPAPRDFWIDRHPVVRRAAVIVKNSVGIMLVVLGVLLSLPGVPGPGVLTILIGLMLLDFPGKRPFERWLVSRAAVLRANQPAPATVRETAPAPPPP